MSNLRGISALVKDLITWFAPVGILVLSVLLWNVPLLGGLALGAVVFVGLYLVFNPQSGRLAIRQASHEEVLKMLEGTRTKVQQLQRLAKGTSKPEIKAKLTTICELANREINELAAKQDTELATASRFDFTFSQTLQIMQLYNDIQSGKVTAEPDKLKILQGKIETDVLDQIQTSLQEFGVRMDRADIVNLETAIQVLENTLKLEGLS